MITNSYLMSIALIKLSEELFSDFTRDHSYDGRRNDCDALTVGGSLVVLAEVKLVVCRH